MEYRIADTFTASLARLMGDEQRAAKTTAFDLQVNPANPGLKFHKLDKAKDKNFWSVRVNNDIRIIVHRTERSMLICYVDHHDKAYEWAERRKLETHPTTGAAQLVEIRETIKEIFVPVYVQSELPLTAPRSNVKPALFGIIADAELLGLGVPPEWLADAKGVTEDTLLELAGHLPAEAAEALLELATGGKPHIVTAPKAVDPFDHPDAQRRFRIITNVEELQQALDYPWDKWAVFLHPQQRELVDRSYNGPARVSGSAGTGKTIVALHRAAFLARTSPDARVLLTTFSDTLAHALHGKLRRLLSNQPRLAERIDVHSLNAIGLRLYKSHIGSASIVDQETVSAIIAEAASIENVHSFSPHFLRTEWDQVVDANQLKTWEAYRDVARLGRKTRLPEAQRFALWSIFERVLTELRARQLITYPELFTSVGSEIGKRTKLPFDFAVVDEAQDISPSHLRFLAALGADKRDALFFAGDLGQRIFQQPFSWKSLGVDIRGRSRTLRVNYRTSHQIRTQADRLLGQMVTDVDGNNERRNDTISVFNGPAPTILEANDPAEEQALVTSWIADLTATGVLAHEFGVFVRSDTELSRARHAVEGAGLNFKVLDDRVETTSGHVSICTMHLAKGLEFRAVAVMACDDDIIPLQSRIESVGDDADLREVYDTERHLLYVACTRARDHLLVTGVRPVSEFLDDLVKG